MLKKLKTCILIVLLTFFGHNFCLSNTSPLEGNLKKNSTLTDSTVRALYVDNFFLSDSSSIILGDSLAEEQLFDYAQNCGFNYLILYGLAAVPLGSNPEALNALRSFIGRAHVNYGIKIGCVGQSSKFFERIHEKYQTHELVTAEERIDSYNLEFEFWKSFHSDIYLGYYCENYLQPNGYSCDSIGAFQFAMDELNKIDSLASLLANPALFSPPSIIETEIYIGWINEIHAQQLAVKMENGIIDRILGAVYQPALPNGDLELYNFYHQTRRLSFLGLQNSSISFLPIFAVKENAGFHLRDWLDTIGSLPLVWEHYSEEFMKDTNQYTEHINLKGYVWYNYSNIPICLDSLEYEGFLEGPEGEIVKDSLYNFNIINPGNADRFYWSLPEGVSFFDAHPWDSQAYLVFSDRFKEGDTIEVRAANRCHLANPQYFPVENFNPVSEIVSNSVNIQTFPGKIVLNMTSNSPSEFTIYDTRGNTIQSGKGLTNHISISFQFPAGIYIIHLKQDNQSFSKKFFWP